MLTNIHVLNIANLKKRCLLNYSINKYSLPKKHSDIYRCWFEISYTRIFSFGQCLTIINHNKSDQICCLFALFLNDSKVSAIVLNKIEIIKKNKNKTKKPAKRKIINEP